MIENDTGSPPDADTDRTSEFEYDGNGNVTKRTEINPDTGNQVTRYVFGVGANSDLYSNDLLRGAGISLLRTFFEIVIFVGFLVPGRPGQVTDLHWFGRCRCDA